MGNKGRKGKGPKPMKVPRKVRKESAKQERKNLLTENPVVDRSKESVVKRFQGSTKKLGNTEAMNAMMKGKLQEGLAADLGARLAKATLMTKPKMPKAIKKPLGTPVMSPRVVSEKESSFTPSKRDMELKSAHLGEAATPKAASAKGPKPQKPKSKSMKPKGRLKRKIKGKY